MDNPGVDNAEIIPGTCFINGTYTRKEASAFPLMETRPLKVIVEAGVSWTRGRCGYVSILGRSKLWLCGYLVALAEH